MPNAPLTPSSRFRPAGLCLIWLLFIVYGSLVPLDFQFVTPEAAWQRFANAPMLQLGATSRADWIANGLLYFPLGFLATLSMAGVRQRPRLQAVLAACMLSALVALVVEYLQVYFPPRTVSRNDLLAEAIGATTGAATAWAGHASWQRLTDRLASAGARLAASLGGLYLAALLVLAVFPFDFVLNASEWSDKWHGASVGLWMAPSTLERTAVILVIKLLVEVVLLVPVGLWLAWRGTCRSVPAALLAGAGLGLVIELGQLVVLSGVSQGVSVLTRALGTGLGAWAFSRFADEPPSAWQPRLRRATVWLVPLYLPLLAVAYGWGQLGQADVALVQRNWDALEWLPFYYHYYTTETVAVSSLFMALLAYAPVGVLGWAWEARPYRAPVLALLLAGCIEAGRLLLPGAHPDPTNLWIAAAGAAMARRLCELWVLLQAPTAVAQPPAQTVHPVVDDRRGASAGPPPDGWAASRWAVVAAVALLLAAWVVRFPWQPLAVGLLILVAAALVGWRPRMLFMLVPMALPVLDLAPMSGRRFVDEFDLMLAACMTVAWARWPRASRAAQPPATTSAWALAAVLAMLAVGVGRTLWPWGGLDADAFDHPMSAMNALRVAKGGVWCVLLWWLGRRAQAHGVDVGRSFGTGMCVGLALTVLVVVAERAAFSGLFDFSSNYRVSAMFSDMSLGGAYVECFLACALPFLLHRLLSRPTILGWILGLMVLAGASYALMVTYSRGGQIAGAAAVLIVLAMHALKRRAQAVQLVLSGVLLATVAVAALPALRGEFAQQRLSTVDADLVTRQRHWTESLDLVDAGAASTALGMGLGRYAELRLFHLPPDQRTASHRIPRQQDGSRVLRLSSGPGYYVDQMVTRLPPGSELQLQLRTRVASIPPASAVRPTDPSPPQLAASLCQKWIIAAAACSQAKLAGSSGKDGWWTLSARVTVPPDVDGQLPKPLRLSLHNGGPVVLDVAAVSLRAPDGRELVANGNFAAGSDRWTFTSDDHLAWHAKSMLVGTFVELGWMGVAAFAALLLTGAARAISLTARGGDGAAPILAALSAFTIVGLVDTLLDVPRFLLLFMLLCVLPALWPPSGRPAAGQSLSR